jgi:hypothetical protein
VAVKVLKAIYPGSRLKAYLVKLDDSDWVELSRAEASYLVEKLQEVLKEDD